MNLTAITAPRDVATLHLLDCAALAAQLDLSGKRVIDVGTGAGFPGMVLAILTPDARFTLLDSLGKRVDFLKEVQRDLGLKKCDLRSRPGGGIRRAAPGAVRSGGLPCRGPAERAV